MRAYVHIWHIRAMHVYHVHTHSIRAAYALGI